VNGRARAAALVAGALLFALALVPTPSGMARCEETGPVPAAGEFVEPPPEEEEGTDYAAEPADSIEEGAIELGVGASGVAGAKPRQTRRVRFSDRAIGGSVREGAGDPLAGGSIETGTLAGRVGVGRLAPRWGRGLLLGARPEPWSAASLDRGGGTPFRGRSGRGAWYRAGRSGTFESLYGRFGKRDLAGARLSAGTLGFGTLADRSGRAQTSLSFARGPVEHELAFDRSGRWRGEAALTRSLARAEAVAWARGGHSGFSSLAEPSRSGPSRVMGLDLASRFSRGRAHWSAALWRFRPGRSGARTALDVERTFHQHGSLAIGFEERHGAHRATGRDPGLRQGGWGEWRGEAAGVALALRHEVLGAQPFGREAVRTVTALRLEIEGPAGSGLGVTHSAYRVRPGESLYLAEAASDRVVLRAVSGTGRRTRLEVRAPGAGGRIHAALDLPSPAGSRTGGSLRPEWTLDWTRRARSR